MKTVEIPTNWTPEQADSVYRFIDSIKESIWRAYNDELKNHYRKIKGITVKSEISTDKKIGVYEDFDDNIPF